VLRSPLHALLSRSVALVRYSGTRSGRVVSTPVQYERRGNDILVLAGRPETKTWWRNFRTDRDLDVLLRGRWLPMRARAVVGADDPDATAPLLAAYLERFPRAARALGDGTPAQQAARAVVVWCRPR
jgi:hypothetical protein